MCGRLALSATTKSIEKLVKNLKIEDNIKPRINIAPTTPIPIVKNQDNRELDYAHLGAYSVLGKG